MVRRRVSFEDGGRRLDNLFKLIFTCSVWPSDDVRDVVLDLVLLRNHRADFHAYYQDQAAVFAVDTIECLGNTLPKTQQRLVEAWARDSP
jgi:Domain of unknown function (DUF4160)